MKMVHPGGLLGCALPCGPLLTQRYSPDRSRHCREPCYTSVAVITENNGASGRIRTSDRSVRSRVLYPAELRMHRDYCLLLIQCHSSCRNTDEDGASGRIRTSDRSVRSRVLYPAELRMQMAVRRGFEPRMQLLTAYSLSRGAPSASRPPHQTPLASAPKNLFLLIGAAWRTYYFLGLISQTIFPDSVSFAQFTRNSSALPTKRAFYQHETGDET